MNALAGPAPLRTGCWSFTAGPDIRANAGVIRRGLRAARAAGVQVLLTPECALTGYPGAARPDLLGIDWCLVGNTEDSLLTEAAQLGIDLVLGSAEPVGTDNVVTGIANEAVTMRARYRKRRLTPGDTAHFVPGDRAVVIELAGWRCGLAICYDLRFPALWRELAEAGAEVVLVLAHMAGPDPDPGVKGTVIPAFCAVRAAEWATPVVFCNTSAEDRWLGSGVWDARGVETHHQQALGEHLLVAEVQPRTAFAPWYARLRADSLGPSSPTL